ncbi:MAG: hypothetical protein AAB678_03500 [Patescibacteria group bacterium]
MIFRHSEAEPALDQKKGEAEKSAQEKEIKPAASKTAEPASVQELLEKNLKWSQIIYEQNRRLNSKLLWSAIASWLRFFIIAIPLVIALVYLPSLYREFKVKYDQLLGGDGKTQTLAPSSLDQLFKLLPLDAAKQEQLKAILK